MSKVWKTAWLLAVILLFASCSRQNKTSPEELRSDLTSATSFAAEAEIVVAYIRQDRITKNYAEGHLKYLVDEINRSRKELDQAAPDQPIQQPFRECRTQLELLAKEVTAARLQLGHPDALAATAERIATIHQTLERVKSSL